MPGKKQQARWIRRFNGLSAIFWFGMIPVSLFTSLRTSIAYVVFLSVYNPAVNHLTAWVSGRAEVASLDNPPSEAGDA